MSPEHGWRPRAATSDCVSARELVAAGFADDVALALEVDVQSGVPVRQPDGRSLAGSLSAQRRSGIAQG